MSEQWRPVPGWEGSYEVSDHGRVRSLDRDIEQMSQFGSSYVRRFPGRVLIPFRVGKGYLAVSLGEHDRRYVHHLVCETWHGPRPTVLPDGCKRIEACHGDSDKNNNTPGNLRWDTSAENKADRKRLVTA